MSLDDPAQCKRAELYKGDGFPGDTGDVVAPAKTTNLSQGFAHAKGVLENALAGFCSCPEEYFKDQTNTTIDEFIKYLKDPKLPLDEMKEVMASIQGRIPHKVEKAIVKALSSYEQNITSVLAQFPAQKISSELLAYLASIEEKEKDIVEMTISPVMELCNRYKNGVKGHLKVAVSELIDAYLDVEKTFQVTHYDKVLSLTKTNLRKSCFDFSALFRLFQRCDNFTRVTWTS